MSVVLQDGTAVPPDCSMRKVVRLGATGRPRPSVPVKELLKNRSGINGASQNLVRKEHGSSLAFTETQKSTTRKEARFGKELKILPSDEGFSWAKDSYNLWQRMTNIWGIVMLLRIRILFDNANWAYVDGFSEEKQKTRRRGIAAWLREQVLQLGPTFIKLGQLSSTRSDLFPKGSNSPVAALTRRLTASSGSPLRILNTVSQTEELERCLNSRMVVRGWSPMLDSSSSVSRPLGD